MTRPRLLHLGLGLSLTLTVGVGIGADVASADSTACPPPALTVATPSSTTVSSGLLLKSGTVSFGGQSVPIHVVSADLTDGSFSAKTYANKISQAVTVTDAVKATGALLGINGDFFHITSDGIHLVADGPVYAGSGLVKGWSKEEPAFVVDGATARVDWVHLAGTVTITEPHAASTASVLAATPHAVKTPVTTAKTPLKKTVAKKTVTAKKTAKKTVTKKKVTTKKVVTKKKTTKKKAKKKPVKRRRGVHSNPARTVVTATPTKTAGPTTTTSVSTTGSVSTGTAAAIGVVKTTKTGAPDPGVVVTTLPVVTSTGPDPDQGTVVDPPVTAPVTTTDPGTTTAPVDPGTVSAPTDPGTATDPGTTTPVDPGTTTTTPVTTPPVVTPPVVTPPAPVRTYRTWTVTLDGINDDATTGPTLYTGGWGPADRSLEEPSTARELSLVGGTVTANSQSIGTGSPTAGTALVVAGNTAAALAQVPVGSTYSTAYTMVGQDGRPISQLIGGNAVLVSGGQVQDPNCTLEGDNIFRPRVSVGVNAARTKIIVVASDGDGSVAGLTLHQMAQTMAKLGADQALNLDAGNSTQLIQRSGATYTQVNHNAQNPPRQVSDSLVFVGK